MTCEEVQCIFREQINKGDMKQMCSLFERLLIREACRTILF